MKDYKRALRRWQRYVKFKKRIKTWTQKTWSHSLQKREEWIKEITEGKSSTFLRTTGSPCNCWMCQYDKYERIPKNKINKKIWEDFQDDMASYFNG